MPQTSQPRTTPSLCRYILVAPMSQTPCPRHPWSPRPRHQKPLEGRDWFLCSFYLPRALFRLRVQGACDAACVHWPFVLSGNVRPDTWKEVSNQNDNPGT